MFSTSITRSFGLTTPIVNAGMAMIARPALAAAVCEAGGLGTIGSDINPPDVLRDLVRQTKTLTKRPFGVDLIGDFVTDEHLSVLIEEQVALAIFFWTLPTPGHVERLKQAGIKVWMQIGRVAEALTTAEDAFVRYSAMRSCGFFRGGFALLTHAEVLEAAGDHAAACAAIRVARERLLTIANRIPDPAYKKSFLEEVPENARTLALASTWLAL
jgi:hypothetical protein